MELIEYIKKAKQELDDFAQEYLKGHESEPELWPLDMDEVDWGDQELTSRFGQV